MVMFLLILTIVMGKIHGTCYNTFYNSLTLGIYNPINQFFGSKGSTSSSSDKKQLQSIDRDLNRHYLSEDLIQSVLKPSAAAAQSASFASSSATRKPNQKNPLPTKSDFEEDEESSTIRLEEMKKGSGKPFWIENLPKINLRCDPLINFKLKQRLKLLGACVTLGLDYLSDIAEWRTYCSIEDTIVKGRFSLRGSELGWAKSWLLNLGLGEENTAKLKLRLGLNLNNYKFYAKLRFRTEPISPFDIGDGLSCAGKVPLPLYLLPLLRKIPLRIEYKLRVNAARSGSIRSKNEHKDRKVYMTTGLGTIDVSLDELNVCLEYDEYAPLWGLGIVRTERKRPKSVPSTASNKPRSSYYSASR